MIADARTDEQLGIGYRDPVAGHKNLEVADVAVRLKGKDLSHLDRFRLTGISPGDLIAKHELDRSRLTGIQLDQPLTADDLVTFVVDQKVYRALSDRKPKGQLTPLGLEGFLRDQLKRCLIRARRPVRKDLAVILRRLVAIEYPARRYRPFRVKFDLIQRAFNGQLFMRCLDAG